MNGERILKFSGQGSVYIQCLEPLEGEDDEDQELLQAVFSDDDTSGSQMTAYIPSSPDEVTQPPATSQNVAYSGCQKYESSPIFVTKLEVRLYPEFLNTQTCTFGLQICTI